jgi:TolB-like protein/class 3 adenylate cyclase/Flp pilus assembly protein TadD
VSEEGVERRLTTILAADVVGYTRLMAADEAGTLTSLKAIRRELFEPKTTEHHGRVVKLMGDGTLMEFGSVVDAVNFAVDLQRAMAGRNVDVPEDRQVTYRIGINIGDIIVEGDDLYGDGVNVAARLEGLAEPGGICVARNVVNQVKGKVDLGFEDLGEREVKNIPNPVQVFKVLLDSPAMEHVAVSAPAAKRSWRWPMAATGIVALVIAAGLALWQRPWEPREELASETNMAFPLPDKPSIAVLPFNNISDDASQEYFADGITEDLITDLSRVSGLFVIARTSSFSYKGQQVKVRQVAEELGVRYVLEGSVRRAGEQVRINAQLIDATTGGHLWAERFDGTLADVFAFQDQVTKRIVDALALQLTPREAQKVGDVGTDNVAAHDAYLLGLSYYYRRTPEDNATARIHFEKAIELDPDYSAAYTALAKVYVKAVSRMSVYAEKLGIWWRAGFARALKPLDKVMAQPNADFHVLLSWFALRKYQYDQAIAEAERALDLSPNHTDALEALAEALIYSGQPAAGIEVAQRAMRQNPALLARPLFLIGLGEYTLGNPEAAVKHLEHAIQQAPEETDFSGILAAAYAELGRGDESKTSFEVLNKAQQLSGGRLEWAIALHPFSDPVVLNRLAEAFKTAGAKVGMAGYLPIYAENQLEGDEIRSLLFGRQIKGEDFWRTSIFSWRQQRTGDGKVEHSGSPIHPGLSTKETGTGRIEKNLLCEHWPTLTKTLELCVAIFRVPEGNARIRWGDYVMATDTGPHPFRLVE